MFSGYCTGGRNQLSVEHITGIELFHFYYLSLFPSSALQRHAHVVFNSFVIFMCFWLERHAVYNYKSVVINEALYFILAMRNDNALLAKSLFIIVILFTFMQSFVHC